MGLFDSWSDDDDEQEVYRIGKVPLSGWKPQYGKGVEATGSSVTISKTSEPHYFMRPTRGEIKYGSTLYLEGTIKGEADTFWNEGRKANNPTFRPMIRKLGDDLTKPFGRFWSNPQAVKLTDGEGDFRLKIPMNSSNWSSVFGKKSKAQLQTLLKNIGWVGITFGGNNNFGHGLRSDPKMVVKITRFEFK